MKLSRLSTNNSQAWAFVDEGCPTLETECLSLLEALGFSAQFYRVSIPHFWNVIPSVLIPSFISKVKVSPKPLSGPWPPFIICGGRSSNKIGRYLKRRHGVFLVSLGAPLSISSDKILVDSYHSLEKKKKIYTLGPLHRIQPETLLHARQSIYRKIDHLSKPRVSLFLKESIPLQGLIDLLKGLHQKSPFSLMIYAEGLTKDREQKIQQAFSEIPHIFWAGQGDNPYLGFLAHSDTIILTDPSSIRVAEATSAEKPVFIYSSSSPNSFVRVLYEKGYAFPLQKDSYLFPRMFLPPLQETQRVADILKEAYIKTISS